MFEPPGKNDDDDDGNNFRYEDEANFDDAALHIFDELSAKTIENLLNPEANHMDVLNDQTMDLTSLTSLIPPKKDHISTEKMNAIASLAQQSSPEICMRIVSSFEKCEMRKDRLRIKNDVVQSFGMATTRKKIPCVVHESCKFVPKRTLQKKNDEVVCSCSHQGCRGSIVVSPVDGSVRRANFCIPHENDFKEILKELITFEMEKFSAKKRAASSGHKTEAKKARVEKCEPSTSSIPLSHVTVGVEISPKKEFKTEDEKLIDRIPAEDESPIDALPAEDGNLIDQVPVEDSGPVNDDIPPVNTDPPETNIKNEIANPEIDAALQQRNMEECDRVLSSPLHRLARMSSPEVCLAVLQSYDLGDPRGDRMRVKKEFTQCRGMATTRKNLPCVVYDSCKFVPKRVLQKANGCYACCCMFRFCRGVVMVDPETGEMTRKTECIDHSDDFGDIIFEFINFDVKESIKAGTSTKERVEKVFEIAKELQVVSFLPNLVSIQRSMRAGNQAVVPNSLINAVD